MYTEQVPKLWTGTYDGTYNVIKNPITSKVIRVVGHQHTLDRLRWLYQVAYDNPEFIFMIYSNDTIALQELIFPSNVIPVLQVENRQTYIAKIKDYLDLCRDREVETPTLSIFCNDIINVSKKIKWLLLSGLSLRNIAGTIRVNSTAMPVYVEHFKFKKKLPQAIDVRNVPCDLDNNLVESVVSGAQAVAV